MNKGIYKYHDGSFDSITTANGLSSNSLNVLTADQDGTLWVALSGKGLNVYRQGKWSFYHTGNGFPSNSVRSFCIGSDSTVWIGTENGLVAWKNNYFHTYTTADGLSDNIITSLFEDKAGTLWIGTERGGICCYNHASFTSYRTTDGLSSDYVTSLLEDHEGSIWVGTFNAGLNQFWKGKFLNYTMHDGVPNSTIRTMMTAHDGSVWIGTEGGGVLRFNGNIFEPVLKNILPSDYIRSLYEDSQRSLWIGLREGLAQYRNGILRVYSTKDGLSQNFIRVMGEDHGGNIWVGTYNNGVNRFEHGRFIDYRDKGLPIYLIRSLLVDHSGAIWIGSNEGLVCKQGNSIKTYTDKDGLPSDPIFDLIEDNEHVLWMGSYGGGLVRMKDSNIVRYTYSNGLFNDVVLKILEDDNGNLWMSSIKGISCISKQMLNDFARGKIGRIQCASYNSSDGMIVSECSTPTGCKTSDGRLWFPTPSGIVVVDPKRMQKNSLPPPVIIERVVVNNIDYSPYTSIQIPHGNGQVEFHYGGMSFIAPQKVYFRYMLEGFDTEWKAVGTRHTAFYTNLAAGTYNFRITACNNDGIWNEAGTSYAFELRPHFYQTSWFYSLILVAFSASLFSLYRLRIWRLIKRKDELEQHVFERTAQLETANKELEAFAYSVSHDLRAPLRAIGSHVNMLVEDYEKHLDDKGKRICSVISNETQHMGRLIDGLLTISRIGYKEMKMTYIDMETLANTIFKELVPVEQQQRIDFHVDHLPSAIGDPTLIREVWINLISNAIKFSSKRERAVIEIGFKQEGQKIIYYIRDNGAGFDMDYVDRLFGVFQRLHSEKEFEGTGVGLALVQRLIHRHGGTIWATSAMDQGATFFFTLLQK